MIKRITGMILVLSLCALTGCAWLSKAKKTTVKKSRPAAAPAGQVVNAQRLHKGGKIVIIPFTAGDDVEASDQLDGVSLTIVKGIADVLRESSAPFDIVLNAQAQQADLILKGHVTQMKEATTFDRWVLREKNITLGVSGEVSDARTGETVAAFAPQTKASSKKKDYRQLGYELGEDIGHFLVSSAANP